MKLVLQIALGVFLGTFSAHLLLDSWHTYQNNKVHAQAEKLKVDLEKKRREQALRIRELILQKQQGNNPPTPKLPPDFVPDDAAIPDR